MNCLQLVRQYIVLSLHSDGNSSKLELSGWDGYLDNGYISFSLGYDKVPQGYGPYWQGQGQGQGQDWVRFMFRVGGG